MGATKFLWDKPNLPVSTESIVTRCVSVCKYTAALFISQAPAKHDVPIWSVRFFFCSLTPAGNQVATSRHSRHQNRVIEDGGQRFAMCSFNTPFAYKGIGSITLGNDLRCDR